MWAISVVQLQVRIRVVEAELARGADVAEESGLDLLDVFGRQRDQLRADLVALRRELAARALLDGHGGGS